MEILPATGANILLSTGDTISTTKSVTEISAIYEYCKTMSRVNFVKAIKFARAEFETGLREAKYFVTDARDSGPDLFNEEAPVNNMIGIVGELKDEYEDDEEENDWTEGPQNDRRFRLLSDEEIQNFTAFCGGPEERRFSPDSPEETDNEGVVVHRNYSDKLKQSGYQLIGDGLFDDDLPF